MTLGHQHTLDRGLDSPTTRPSLEGSGAIAVVNSEPDGDDEITVTVDSFDGGTYSFGPVPYTLGQPAREPMVGDRAFLHIDSEGQPAFALVWGSGAAVGGGSVGADVPNLFIQETEPTDPGDWVWFEVDGTGALVSIWVNA